MTLLGLSLLVGSSWTLGTLTLARMDWNDLRPYERAALTLVAGLGLTSLLISLLTLAGGFRYATGYSGPCRWWRREASCVRLVAASPRHQWLPAARVSASSWSCSQPPLRASARLHQ